LTTAVDVKCNSALHMSHSPFIIPIYTIIVPTNAYKTIEINLSTE